MPAGSWVADGWMASQSDAGRRRAAPIDRFVPDTERKDKSRKGRKEGRKEGRAGGAERSGGGGLLNRGGAKSRRRRPVPSLACGWRGAPQLPVSASAAPAYSGACAVARRDLGAERAGVVPARVRRPRVPPVLRRVGRRAAGVRCAAARCCRSGGRRFRDAPSPSSLPRSRLARSPPRCAMPTARPLRTPAVRR
jgi:hypothetical protein